MDAYISHLSLVHGWLPAAAQAITVAVLVCAIGWRSLRSRALRLLVAVAGGVVLALWARWYVGSLGVARDPSPLLLWVWVAAAGVAAGWVALGWRAARWGRRGAAVLALPLCVLCVSLTVNAWVGYLPTVNAAWNQLTAGPLPDQADRAQVIGGQLTACTDRWCCPGGKHPGRCVEVHPPPRTGVPAAGLVRHQAAAPVADRDDDRG